MTSADEWLNERDRHAELRAEIERLKAALRPLLEHYLNCYGGNEDQLAIDARAALEEKP